MNSRTGWRSCPLAWVLAALTLAALVSAVLTVGLGPVSVAPGTAVRILLGRLVPMTRDWMALEENIIWGLRLPRVLLGFMVRSFSVRGGASSRGAEALWRAEHGRHMIITEKIAHSAIFYAHAPAPPGRRWWTAERPTWPFLFPGKARK